MRRERSATLSTSASRLSALNYKPEAPLISYAKLEDGYTEKHGGPLREDEEPWLDEMGEPRNVRELCFD